MIYVSISGNPVVGERVGGPSPRSVVEDVQLQGGSVQSIQLRVEHLED